MLGRLAPRARAASSNPNETEPTVGGIRTNGSEDGVSDLVGCAVASSRAPKSTSMLCEDGAGEDGAGDAGTSLSSGAAATSNNPTTSGNSMPWAAWLRCLAMASCATLGRQETSSFQYALRTLPPDVLRGTFTKQLRRDRLCRTEFCKSMRDVKSQEVHGSHIIGHCQTVTLLSLTAEKGERKGWK